MSSKFGFLSKINFLQDFASVVIAGLNPAIVHNLGKYMALKKVHYLSAVDDTPGDYLEFGVFQGSSMCHSIRCCKKLSKFNPNISNTRFFGFDSFDGFGKVSEDEKHSFFTDENFPTSLAATQKRVQKVAGDLSFQLISGYFKDSLAQGANSLGIEKAKVVMIDCDTYSAANEALEFCIPIVQQGTIFLLDDYFYYRGNKENGEMRAFAEFIEKTGIEVREVCTYGMGSIVYVVSHLGTYDAEMWKS